MSDPSLHDTAIDLTPVGPPRPWRAHESAGSAAAVGLVTGGAWLAVALACRLLSSPLPHDPNLRMDRLEAVALLAGGGGVAGLLVGGLAGFLGRRPARARSGFAWGLGLAGMSA